MRAEFENPSVEYRGAPFWSWNDDLDPDELCRQVDEMRSAGMGGFFMHSRDGLITEYLGPEWMDCVRRVVRYAGRTGMKAWLYDEDRWPSGFAGGIVPARSDEYRLRAVAPFQGRQDDALRVFLVKRVGEGIADYRDVTGRTEVVPSDGEELWSFKVVVAPDRERFNGYSYVDLMNPDVVKAFLESTFDAYAREVGDEFGKTIPGIFTDEPNFCPNHAVPDGRGIPWTGALPDYFKQRCGYDILDKLPLLFWEGPGSPKVRYDFWRTVTARFVEVYGKGLYDWCERHGLALTGHYLHEDSFTKSIWCTGATMPFYEYMHIPGIDHLCRNIDILPTVKQCSSVAHQFGRGRVLSELYGCSGWNCSLEDQKWIGEWEYVLGVNFRCQHLSLYSLRGCRKLDFPPSIFYQQPWWPDHKALADSFARLGLMLTQGEPVADILVIHTIATGWVNYSPLDSRKTDEANERFQNTLKWLTELHRDYDLGDEMIMQRHARVRGKRLVVGRRFYKVVVVPPAETLSSSTVKLLADFAAAGGTIIAVEPTPTLVDGSPDSPVAAPADFVTVPMDKEALAAALDGCLRRDISVTEADGAQIPDIYACRRDAGDKQIYFFVNISREKTYDARITVSARGVAEHWDHTTGAVRPLAAKSKRAGTALRLGFEPGQSYVVVIAKEPSDYSPAPPATRRSARRVSAKARWRARRLSPNILTLDYAEYKIGGGAWQPSAPVWKIDRAAREAYGLPLINHGGVMFWKRYPRMKPLPDAKVAVRFTFRVTDVPSEIDLVMENPERYRVTVNGRPVEKVKPGWWIDISFRRLAIADLVKKGRNTIVLEAVDYNDDLELQPVYLCGEFAVAHKDRTTFRIKAEKGELRKGDWVDQGYPFFCGRMELTQTIAVSKEERRRYFVELDQLGAVTVRVQVNGTDCGLVAWRPYRVDVTDALVDGENELRLVLATSLHNMLGPHHHNAGELYGVSPGSFMDERAWVDSYTFVPQGILGRVSIAGYEVVE